MNSHATSECSEAYIALGANLGEREGNLMEALERLDDTPGIQVLRVSHLYETEPVGYIDQPMFLNMAAVVSTSLSPHALLAEMQRIEKELGRVRHIHWGPRTVDLDLLWMEGRRLDTPELMLPHPRMQERSFVLRPLSDIVFEDEPSGLYRVVQTALAKLEGKEGIQLWKTSSWRSVSALSEN
ncbi:MULTISPECIES: 2-amino-4-hydroxy-6-hydroxymethyldihydropteridine diphosphokinase [Paenibacillus]|uniref:2-amino-4-hydroxy-6-hydroxymethyldihydropteridine diphosphokinase n=2 Tax=Paenibacillus lactis TaxID=228574 RepID=G4HP45_9BACL|nr:2-amino-4-hydroxy-6-hydroxymethyldihydropteridine diphosphokinase [Paenibacillus lactis]EHB49677.1 2-amino-4-hydroxy-6-hydroxymethyldihydropteridine pyrophosphokinase [Paenibacillus lactis 154]MBP1896578.1 2-amino-4-hydroxy-6-hydroxymethyldihydropteridine diphosphokinase [Paenibacillus lactis]HAF98033.1 2-amino-4-hydroxy-6-hydroxymethyldihydropteridine diphosphokinase [Paenibacillus lactis]